MAHGSLVKLKIILSQHSEDSGRDIFFRKIDKAKEHQRIIRMHHSGSISGDSDFTMLHITENKLSPIYLSDNFSVSIL